jgi:ubiquitin carboxyl-terminal hydrolase 36/42
MNYIYDFRFFIDLMQMICVDKVVAEKFLDDSIQEMTLIHHYFGGCLQSQLLVTRLE